MTRPAPQVIGICGGKGQGKDTVAQHLRTRFSMRQIAFADPMKAALAVMFNVPEHIFHEPDLKEKPLPELLGRTPRYLMVTLGTEWGRDLVHPELWTTLLSRRLDLAVGERMSVVVSDVRFDNEAQIILDRGGELWQVTGRTSQYGTTDHRSEVGVDPGYVTRTIINNADLHTLHTQIGVALDDIDRRIRGSAL